MLLEMRDAAFEQRGVTLAAASTILLAEGAHLAHACTSEREASILAMMAAGLVKPTRGRVYVAAFDPRIQPVQVKRVVGYVPHEAVPHHFASLTKYVEYRAALWGLPRAQSIVRARALLERLDGVHEAFAFPLIGALLAYPRLLVLDRPQAVFAPQIAAAAGACGIFSTHGSQRDAERFLAHALVRA
jgi:ABC-2 type transport system ATP-binding protein